MSASVIRWSGLALMLGELLDIVLYFARSSQDLYIFTLFLSTVGVGLIIFGLTGLQMLQAKQTRILGFIALVIIAFGLMMALVISYVSLMDTVIVYGIVVTQVLGFVLLGISMNRAAVFPRHSGTGLIILSLLTLVIGTRLLLAIFLIGLGYRIFSGKVTSTRPAQ